MMSEDRKLTPSGARKVPPNPEAPRLRKKTEERVAPADEKSARAYDALEAAAAKLDALKEQVEEGHIQVELQVGDTAVHLLKKI
jgi:hypothetical protein